MSIERFKGSKRDIVDLWDQDGFQGICGLRAISEDKGISADKKSWLSDCQVAKFFLQRRSRKFWAVCKAVSQNSFFFCTWLYEDIYSHCHLTSAIRLSDSWKSSDIRIRYPNVKFPIPFLFTIRISGSDNIIWETKSWIYKKSFFSCAARKEGFALLFLRSLLKILLFFKDWSCNKSTRGRLSSIHSRRRTIKFCSSRIPIRRTSTFWLFSLHTPRRIYSKSRK